MPRSNLAVLHQLNSDSVHTRQFRRYLLGDTVWCGRNRHQTVSPDEANLAALPHRGLAASTCCIAVAAASSRAARSLNSSDEPGILRAPRAEKTSHKDVLGDLPRAGPRAAQDGRVFQMVVLTQWAMLAIDVAR